MDINKVRELIQQTMLTKSQVKVELRNDYININIVFDRLVNDSHRHNSHAINVAEAQCMLDIEKFHISSNTSSAQINGEYIITHTNIHVDMAFYDYIKPLLDMTDKELEVWKKLN